MNVTVIIAHRESEHHLESAFLDLLYWFGNIIVVGPDCPQRSQFVKKNGGTWVCSESPHILTLWEKGVKTKEDRWYLLMRGTEYLSTVLKDSIMKVIHSSNDRQAFFPFEQKKIFFEQLLKYPLGWTHEPRSGLLLINQNNTNLSGLIFSKKYKPLNGTLLHFGENNLILALKNAAPRVDLLADHLYRKYPELNKRLLLTRAVRYSILGFFENFIFNRGMREGFEGLVLCLLDSMVTLLGHLRYYEKYVRSGRQIADKLSGFENILIIKLRGIGDAVLGTPVLKNLKTLMPDITASVVTFNFSEPIFKNNPHIDELFCISGDPGSEELSQIIKILNTKKFDLIINLHARNFSSSFAKKIRARWRINRSYFLRERYSDVLIGSDHALDKTSIERDLDCLRAIGLNPQDKNPEIFITDKEIQWAEDFMIEEKIDPVKKLIIIHPSSSQDYKNWALERFIILSRRLIHDHGYQVLGCFPKKERSTAELLLDQVKEIFVYVGPLRRSMALISKADLLIDNGSGPSHISSALNIPTLVLMGPQDYKNTYYDRDIHKEKGLLFYRDVPCRDLLMSRCLPPDPCQNQVCLDHPVEDILKKSLEILQRQTH